MRRDYKIVESANVAQKYLASPIGERIAIIQRFYGGGFDVSPVTPGLTGSYSQHHYETIQEACAIIAEAHYRLTTTWLQRFSNNVTQNFGSPVWAWVYGLVATIAAIWGWID